MVRLFFLFVLTVYVSRAQEVYVVDARYPVHDVMTHLQIIEDDDSNYTPDIILKDSTLPFLKRDAYGRFLNAHSTYWGKCNLRTSDALWDWTLQLEDRFIGPPAWVKSNGKVDVYAYVDNKLVFHKKTGVEYAKDERDTDKHWVLNGISLLNLPINEDVTLVVRVTGNQLGYPPYFNLTIRSPKQPFYHQIFEIHNSINIFMFGVTFIIFLYHLLQFFYLKERVFLWFSIWLLFCTLTHAMTIGLILGSFTKFRFELWMFIANGIFFSFWFFGRAFTDSKNKFPKLDKLVLALSLFIMLEIVGTIIYTLSSDVKPLFTNIGVHYIILNIYSVGALILSVLFLFQKDFMAKYFGFGSLIASIFLILGTLWSMGILKSSIFVDPFATGMFLQIIIYSFGIAYRQQQLAFKNQEEKLKAQETYAEMQRVKDLDEVKTRFFANISHEFRTPLSLISGPIHRAFKNNSENDAITISPKNFEIIKSNTNRLQNLVDQLLDLSKIESGKVHLSLKQGGIVKFIRSIVFSFESMAERQNISLNTSFPEELDFAFYDKDKLEKIVTNILSNAFKYTSENGSVTVNVEQKRSYLSIEVSDTGKGIDKEEIHRIFERFYRVEGSEEKGSGIGLALTKELIELHNGTISVDSTKHKGTRFKIRLPITLEHLPEAISVMVKSSLEEENIIFSNHSNLETPPNPDVVAQSAKTNVLPVVLIVEDNKDLQYYISEVLKESYTILTAKDGLQGERMAFEHIPDIVISDVMMPKKDGYELCNTLKNNTKTSHIPIIMLTAKAGQSNKLEGLTQGADAYLTKPFNDDELLLLMNNLVSSRKKLWEHFKALDMLLVDDIDVTSIDDKFLQNVFKVIKTNLDNENFGVEDIARAVGFSRSQLHRKLKALSDKSANQLITETRLNEAHRMLKLKTGTVSDVAYSVGYSNLSYFSKSFKEKFGVLPSKI